MDIKLIFTILTLHFFALISPGPDFVLAVRNSLQFGRMRGFATALGFGLGIALHLSYCIAGIAFILNDYPNIYNAIRHAGASYLIWIGSSVAWKTFKDKKTNKISLEKRTEQNFSQCLRQGFITNVLNPKVTLFILGIYTTIIPLNTSLSVLIFAGALMVNSTVIWFSAVSWLFSMTIIQNGYFKMEKVLNFIFSAFFIFIGIKLFIT